MQSAGEIPDPIRPFYDTRASANKASSGLVRMEIKSGREFSTISFVEDVPDLTKLLCHFRSSFCICRNCICYPTDLGR